MLQLVAVLLSLAATTSATVYNIVDEGAVADEKAYETALSNTVVINNTLAKMAGHPGDQLVIPNNTFWVAGGIHSVGLVDATIVFDGTLAFNDEIDKWPRDSSGHVLECTLFENAVGLTFTSHGEGTLYGNGMRWWGFPGIGYLVRGEDRPRLMRIENSTDILLERLFFHQSPYWNFFAHDVARIEIRDSRIEVRRDKADYHDLIDISAFNTDGFDIAGRDVYIHDVTVWNDDDCVCVKQMDRTGQQAQCSENWLVERVNASGVGLTIGSIGPSAHHSCVRNVTFRDSVMPHTFKGLYLKSRPAGGHPTDTGEITDVLYENITITRPTQWGIWIGPQQAGYKDACSLLWPQLSDDCPVPSEMTWSNLTFRDITIVDPVGSPGVILGNATNPMRNIVFDNVVVKNPGSSPWGNEFYGPCVGVQNAVAEGTTSPAPPCFKQVK